MKTKSVKTLICRTSSGPFKAYYAEMCRHEKALSRIYAKDKKHIHVPEETGSVHQVTPKHRLLVTFYRCAVCMKDLTEKEVKHLTPPH